MHDLDLILTLAGGFTAALILGYFTQRAGLSPIVGYLLAGTLVGPHTPGFVANAEIAEQLAEVGVILLMQVLARAAYLRDLADMQKAGADRVFTGEGEVALGLIETILERLGATAEQIDRERSRAHRELFGKEPAESGTLG